MREDMFKVIVERPRLIHGNWLGGGREPGFRQRMAREDVPAKVGMRASHNSRKWLNENLTPLRRFLEKQVGRPWNKVHAELLQGIDQRNTVQQHILTHVEDFVLLQVRAEPRVNSRGRPCGVRFLGWQKWGGWTPVEESRSPLFVDPRSGVLRATESKAILHAQRRSKAREAREADLALRRVISETLELRCAEGVWYAVTVDATPGPELIARSAATGVRRHLPHVYDVWKRRLVSRDESTSYATSKRQLATRDLRRYGIAAGA